MPKILNISTLARIGLETCTKSSINPLTGLFCVMESGCLLLWTNLQSETDRVQSSWKWLRLDYRKTQIYPVGDPFYVALFVVDCRITITRRLLEGCQFAVGQQHQSGMGGSKIGSYEIMVKMVLSELLMLCQCCQCCEACATTLNYQYVVRVSALSHKYLERVYPSIALSPFYSAYLVVLYPPFVGSMTERTDGTFCCSTKGNDIIKFFPSAFLFLFFLISPIFLSDLLFFFKFFVSPFSLLSKLKQLVLKKVEEKGSGSRVRILKEIFLVKLGS